MNGKGRDMILLILKMLSVLGLTFIAGLLYRMGGSGDYDTKARDIGCSICMVLTIALLGLWHWSVLICFFLMFGAMTTYWGFVNKWFGKSTKDKYWWNWMLTGIGYSLAMLPLAIATDHYQGFLVRTFVCTLLITLWSEVTGNVKYEEGGRGGINNVTLILLLVNW